jgi:hypothetical protein
MGVATAAWQVRTRAKLASDGRSSCLVVVRQTVPLRERPVDWILVGFFVVNLGFITCIVDLGQLLIADVTRFEYPLCPPRALVDLVH